MEEAERCKELVEIKQRAVQKYNELNKADHKPAYFTKELNPVDSMEYWIYNNRYFEHDRVK